MTPDLATSSRRSIRILYAEDLEELRDLMEIVLMSEGHQIECVPDGRHAWARIEASPQNYDLLITDHHMPGMNGLELARRVRQSPFPGKVLVFSSELSPAVDDAYHALGVDAILDKPISPAQLKQTLGTLFEVRSAAAS